MPFIPFEQRDRVRRNYDRGRGIQEPGELSYIVADAIDAFVGGQYRFDRLAAAKGAVQAALDQFDELVVKPYEAGKRREHGEVFVLSTRLTGGPE